jgi:hypothetical protein
MYTFSNENVNLPHEENNDANNMIYFTTNNREYFVGDIINGTVYLKLAQKITFTDITLELMLSQFWQQQNGVSDFKNDIICSQKIHTNVTAKNNDEAHILEQGEYKYDFQFEIPKLIQPSFEYPDAYTPCYHRYTLIAKIESQVNPSSAQRVLCLKTYPQQFKNEELFTTSNVTDIKSYGIFTSGNCTLSASYDNPYVKYSSSVPMKFDINNSECTLNTYALRVKLIRKVSGGNDKTKATFVKEDIIYEVDIPVTIGQEVKRMNHSALLRDEKLNQFNFTELSKKYPTVKEWLMLMPTCNGSLVKCEYSVRGTLYFQQFVRYAHRPRTTLPFYVVHVSQDELDHQERQQLEHQQMMMNSNNNSYSNYIPENQMMNMQGMYNQFQGNNMNMFK